MHGCMGWVQHTTAKLSHACMHRLLDCLRCLGQMPHCLTRLELSFKPAAGAESFGMRLPTTASLILPCRMPRVHDLINLDLERPSSLPSFHAIASAVRNAATCRSSPCHAVTSRAACPPAFPLSHHLAPMSWTFCNAFLPSPAIASALTALASRLSCLLTDLLPCMSLLPCP